ncbi:DUF5063 domain-containing protein [Cellulomonas sp. H30R-01]|uniref:DUF5063 domain-containing protein n=1 Tax=Cellulomonas algicola TaxID=2071633 RepID=A0A401UX10_9CELL|nr:MULTISPECIES: DUF5063 domain-containing protein [Cellulomonas]QHT57145.1 DUF5063 domain-containing protein [Cellulomonas sp. H30R-01]GCD19130.1 hypothetical protein CTKZ_06920 [Cellulomonas algicola]
MDTVKATTADADLLDLARAVADESRSYLTTVTEVAAGTTPEATLPLLLLAVSDVLAVGARLGATTDVVPAERFEPDRGPDPDVDPLRAALANVFEGIDEYAEVVDPLVTPELEQSSVSGDLVAIAQALAQGLRHYEAGSVTEALWWWQFSYLSDWGERASGLLRVIQTMLAHLRLDVDDDVAAEAEYDALQS